MNPERLQTLARARRQADTAAALLAHRDRSPLPPGRTGAEMNASLGDLVEQIGPRAGRAFPGIAEEDVQAVCGVIVLLGPRDVEEAWLSFFLMVEYGQQLSPLEIREAVRVLGVEADLCVYGWLQRHHQRQTGAASFLRALWEYEAGMRLNPAGQEMARELFGLRHPQLAAGLRARQFMN